MKNLALVILLLIFSNITEAIQERSYRAKQSLCGTILAHQRAK